MEPLVLTLPWAPTVNTYYRSVAMRGRTVVLISKEGRAYKETVRGILREMQAPHFGLARLAIDVLACPPDSRERDLDNLRKALFDSLSDELESKKSAARRGEDAVRQVASRGIWCRDSQIDDDRMRRGPVVKGGRMVVTVTELARVEQQLELAA